uniref:Uncharacterized protein n=1 Tax=Oryza nivara TaxID=4536 RepID=A0A0E0GJW6_ORYNI
MEVPWEQAERWCRKSTGRRQAKWVTAAGATTARKAEGAKQGGGERSSSNPLSAPISTMEVCVLLFLLLEPIAIVFVIFNGHNGGEAGGKRELTRCRPRRGRCQGQRAARRMVKVGARAAMVMRKMEENIRIQSKEDKSGTSDPKATKQKGLRTLFFLIAWKIWKERNARIFRAKEATRDSSRTVTTRPKVVGLVSTQRALVQIFMLKDPMF